MKNDDLISRAAAIEAALDGADDWDGGCNPSREEYIRGQMAKVPAVDAIPVKWLRDLQHRAMVGGYTELEGNIMMLLREWQQEIGARMDGGPDA